MSNYRRDMYHLNKFASNKYELELVSFDKVITAQVWHRKGKFFMRDFYYEVYFIELFGRIHILFLDRHQNLMSSGTVLTIQSILNYPWDSVDPNDGVHIFLDGEYKIVPYDEDIILHLLMDRRKEIVEWLRTIRSKTSKWRQLTKEQSILVPQMRISRLNQLY